MQIPDPKRLPTHVGIIMDGNGRWAKSRNLPRSAGHKEGLKAAKSVVKAASDLGVPYVTLYTFSTENWKRAKEEISFLMRLIRMHLKKEWDFYRENRIKVVHSGDLSRLPQSIQREIQSVVHDTSEFDRMTLNLAINYGGRDEIVRGVNRWLASRETGGAEGQFLTESMLRDNLDCPAIPDADLIIRTGEEQRTSNFLLWQSAYSELYFSAKLWPDWCPDDLYEAICAYQRRRRNYGAVPEEAGGGR